ncbi:hypothetical protein [Rhodosalinus sp. 5P4]|uniref:hypothetical protein n=1 Tax=Rhodosalinus sp. 5P4 TaxID=3239196 RepID=UPI003526B74E
MTCHLKTRLKDLYACDAGATLVEYAIAILLAVAVGTAALVALGQQTNGNLFAATAELRGR